MTVPKLRLTRLAVVLATVLSVAVAVAASFYAQRVLGLEAPRPVTAAWATFAVAETLAVSFGFYAWRQRLWTLGVIVVVGCLVLPLVVVSFVALAVTDPNDPASDAIASTAVVDALPQITAFGVALVLGVVAGACGSRWLARPSAAHG